LPSFYHRVRLLIVRIGQSYSFVFISYAIKGLVYEFVDVRIVTKFLLGNLKVVYLCVTGFRGLTSRRIVR